MRATKKDIDIPHCSCGRPAVLTSCGGKKMIACSDTCGCCRRTGWHSNEAQAIKAWTVMVKGEQRERTRQP